MLTTILVSIALILLNIYMLFCCMNWFSVAFGPVWKCFKTDDGRDSPELLKTRLLFSLLIFFGMLMALSSIIFRAKTLIALF